jgi:hypothetical protein
MISITQIIKTARKARYTQFFHWTMQLATFNGLYNIYLWSESAPLLQMQFELYTPRKQHDMNMEQTLFQRGTTYYEQLN